jgi:tripartite ATP-independent transporter DctM subunit
VIPGILVTILFSVINVIWAKKFNLVMESEESVKQKRREIVPRFTNAFPALLMPVIILGGIYGGIFTPTEAAAVAAIYSIPVGFWVYKGLKMGSFYELLKESATSVGSIMTMIMFCLMLSQTLVLLKVPQMVVELLMGLTTNKFYLLLLINIVLFIAGMIVNDITGIILLGPLLLPLVLELGLSPVHFGAIMGVNLSMGGVTPPYASILYLGMRIGKCEFSEILYPTMVLLVLGYIPVVLLTTYWAPLSVWLPSLLGY